VAGGNYGYPTVQMPNKAPELAQSDSTVKPLRSYWKTIAPTQAIFYQGAKFPELDGKFVFGSYNNGRLYAFNVDNKDQTLSLEEELKIEFPSSLTSNVIAVAESPSGNIYYGGYYIYKLKSIDNESRKTAFAPITAEINSQYNIADITFDRANASITIDMEKQTQRNSTTNMADSPSAEFGSNGADNGDDLQGNSTPQSKMQNIVLTLTIDKQILADIESVTISEERGDQDFGEHSVGFTVQTDSDTEGSDEPIVVSIPIAVDEGATSLDISIR
jgi:hypothetical protein